MRVFVIFCALCMTAFCETEQVVTAEKKREWQKLYPKLNSKMARMEELLNAIERLYGDASFKSKLLENALEFSYLAEASLENIPHYLPKEEVTTYKQSLVKSKKLGLNLYVAIDKGTPIKEILSAIDDVRRKSHAQWAE